MSGGKKKLIGIKGDGVAYISIPNLNTSYGIECLFSVKGVTKYTSQKTNVPYRSIIGIANANGNGTNYFGVLNTMNIIVRRYKQSDSYSNIVDYKKNLYFKYPNLYYEGGEFIKQFAGYITPSIVEVCKILDYDATLMYLNIYTSTSMTTMKHKLIPYIQDGEVGLLDKIDGTFYGNANPSGGVFTPVYE